MINIFKLYFVILLSFLLNSFFTLGADFSENHERKLQSDIEKWAILDLSFRVNETVSNPFDISFEAVFQHEKADSLTIPGFYNGDNEWVLRFSSGDTGEWKYATKSEISELDGLTGMVRVNQATKADRHGAVTISPKNPKRFIYEDGSPCFPLAFEIDWLFALDAQNPEGIPRTKLIVSELINHGFNMAIMNVYAYNAKWGEREEIDPRYNFAEPEAFPFGGTNENPDHSTLNVDFFKHFDRVISHLHENEIMSHLMIYVWNKFVNWPKPGSIEDNRYFDYVVKRYQAYPNMVWDISKEALAYGMDDMDYITGRIHRLRKLDGFKRLITVHDYKYCEAYPDLIDFISIQEWRPNLYNEMIEVTEKHPGMPVINVEHGGYEQTMHQIFHGAYVDPAVCLERSYTCLFAGTYTTYYWQNSSWYELVYEPFALEKEKQPKFIYYKHLKDFFSEFEFLELTPRQYFYSPYCLTDNESTWIYLLPSGMSALEGMAPREMRDKEIEIQWFNPLTGEYSKPEVLKAGSWTGFVKPAFMSSPFLLAIIKI